MRWQIPAKTFLLGEYAALADAAAIIATTRPCFQVEKTSEPVLTGIHPLSPAGQYWQHHAKATYGLRFVDPWQGQGGLGASSAQFIGAWLAQAETAMVAGGDHEADLLAAYYQFAWDGTGVRPSAYDLMAQRAGGLFFCNRRQHTARSVRWSLPDLDFILVHSGQKLATHHYLQQETLPDCAAELGQYSNDGWQALQNQDTALWIASVQKAGLCLQKAGLLAAHSQDLITQFSALPAVFCAKGCGAMGADVIAVFFTATARSELSQFCARHQLPILASSLDIYYHEPCSS
ncbi:MAG: hypothetical protein JJT82_03490 [Legionellaceae bacterium]|nr:hypothetical protein [Legionellaceae bacterium]